MKIRYPLSQEEMLCRLAQSTCSPRGSYSAGKSWKKLEARLHPGIRHLHNVWIRVACTAAILITACGWTAWNLWHRPIEQITVSTLAETRTLYLPDNSRVILNRYSTLTYPATFHGDERPIQLEGEAYFEVTKDKHHPFKVNAGEVEIQVLGTRFNIEAYQEDNTISTTLLEGSIALQTPVQQLKLHPREQVIYQKEQKRLFLRKNRNTANETAWQQGILSFHNEPLKEIVRQLVNNYHTSIRFDNEELKEYRLTATFHTRETLDDILEILKEAGHLEFRRTTTGYILSSKNN